MFDFSTPSPVSYILAALVVLGLLAIFAIIVRRVAKHGPNPDGNARGRGPRLGVVDTFTLDRNRQLVIVRRDNVEHLLMIGGTNDVLVEANIVRAMPASALRETNFNSPEPMAPTAPPPIPYSVTQPVSPPAPFEIEAPYGTSPVGQPMATGPRLRPAQPNSAPANTLPAGATMQSAQQSVQPAPSQSQAHSQAAQRSLSNPAGFQFPSVIDLSDKEEPSRVREQGPDNTQTPPRDETARPAIDQIELAELAKRLEASLPQVGRTERAAAPPPPHAPEPMRNMAPQVPMTNAPNFGAQAKPMSAPLSAGASASPPQPHDADPSRPIRPSVAFQTRPSAQPAPAMQSPFTPSPGNPKPIFDDAPTPMTVAPMSASPMSASPSDALHMPMPTPVTMAPPAPAQSHAPVGSEQLRERLAATASQPAAAPADQQSNALDENLRRLLGRKVDPQS